MPREFCPRHGKDHPCTCAMGNVYRFVEPVVLLMLAEKGHSYGYELASSLEQYALTDAAIEGAALYRTLRRLEANGYVKSAWDVQGSGPSPLQKRFCRRKRPVSFPRMQRTSTFSAHFR